MAFLLQAASVVAQPTTALPPASSVPALGPTADARSPQAVIDRYCGGCHNARTKSGNFVLEALDVARAGDDEEAWEKVVRKLRGGSHAAGRHGRGLTKPPTRQLSSTLSRSGSTPAAAAQAESGRTETVHRLNRLEYENAIRDLLAVDINAADLLPGRRFELRLRQHRRRAEDVAGA